MNWNFANPYKRMRSEYVADLQWNIRDARTALHNAADMSDWSGVHKYARQVERLERLLFRHESPRSPRWEQRVRTIPGSGGAAGWVFGRGRLP